MLLIILVVFLAVFAIAALVIAAGSGRSTPPEKTRATLASVLVTRSSPAGDEVVDLRKNFALSSIPWVDRLLARMRPATELRRILNLAASVPELNKAAFVFSANMTYGNTPIRIARLRWPRTINDDIVIFQKFPREGETLFRISALGV